MHIGLMLGVTVGCWTACRWRPGPPARVAGLRSLLSFGGHLAGVSFLTALTRVVDKILLGFATGARQVGLYNRSYNLLVVALTQVAEPITIVAVAAMSRIRNEHAAYRSFFRKGTLFYLSLTVPFIAFSLVSAEALVYTLLGNQWTTSISVVRLLSPAALIVVFKVPLAWVYFSNGQSRRQFLWSLYTAPVVFLLLAAGMRWGASGVASALSAGFLITGLPELPYCFRTVCVRVSDFAQALWRPALSSMLAAFAVHLALLTVTAELASGIRLLIELFGFSLIYLLCWLSLPGGVSLAKEALNLRRENPR